MKSKRTKACDITAKVRVEVLERDNHRCIFCGAYSSLTLAHFVGRGRGGLGIKENLVTLCMECHMKADQGTETVKYHEEMCEYLHRLYPDMNPQDLIFRK